MVMALPYGTPKTACSKVNPAGGTLCLQGGLLLPLWGQSGQSGPCSVQSFGSLWIWRGTAGPLFLCCPSYCLSLPPGPVFGSKDNFLGLGVFVDTYPNEEKQQEVSWGLACTLLGATWAAWHQAQLAASEV